MMYVSQIIMLYTLNLDSAVCQFYLNKTRKKKYKRIQMNSQMKRYIGQSLGGSCAQELLSPWSWAGLPSWCGCVHQLGSS